MLADSFITQRMTDFRIITWAKDNDFTWIIFDSQEVMTSDDCQ